ncbi:hypothetical protein KIW84_060419 [Lathyrus oleraceus]|uniref:Uncharacterized protein n=1 Tax=Pisum sativum TaxID=3888 RepID=A0A9D5A2T6_PEA|nr:hypothetical protein KIW84_060419 [Pisum sativum]
MATNIVVLEDKATSDNHNVSTIKKETYKNNPKSGIVSSLWNNHYDVKSYDNTRLPFAKDFPKNFKVVDVIYLEAPFSVDEIKDAVWNRDGSKSLSPYAKWCGDNPLSNNFPDLYCLGKAKENFVDKMGCWHNGVWSWGDLAIHHQQQATFIQRLHKLQIFRFIINSVAGAVDKGFWSNVENSLYSAKQGYECIMDAKV